MATNEELEERIKKIENMLNLFLQEIDNQIETKIKIEEQQILRKVQIEVQQISRTQNLKHFEDRVDGKIKSVISDLLPQIEDQIEISVWNAVNKHLKESLSREGKLTKNESKRVLSNLPDSHGLKDAILEGKISLLEGEEEFEREIILEALKRANNIQTHAAGILGISRRILKYKMDKLGIEEEENSKLYSKQVKVVNSNTELIIDKDIKETP